MSESTSHQTLDGIVAVPNDEGGKATKLSLYRDGEELSRTWIVPYTLRVGATTVRMDGIGGVGTPEEYRNKGYSRQVLTAAVEYMKAGDALLTTLYGIPDYYPRWGYATAGHEGGVRLTRLEIDNVLPEGYSIRPVTEADLPAIRAIYASETKGIVGSALRDEDDTVWRELRKAIAEGRDECRVVISDDAVVAYAWTASFIWWMQKKQREQPEALNIGEAFAVNPEAADALLAALRQWAVELDRPFADIHQPPVGTLGLAMRLQDTVEMTVTFKDGQFMARSTGTLALLAALQPELSRRWRETRTDWRGTVRILTDGEMVDLVLADDVAVVSPVGKAVLMVELSPGDLARLALGSYPPLDLLARIGVLDAAVGPLVALFPERRPYLFPADRF